MMPAAWLQIVMFFALLLAFGKVPRRVHGRRLRRPQDVPGAATRATRTAACTEPPGRRPPPRWVGAPTPSPCWSSTSRACSWSTCSSACRANCPGTHSTWAPCPPTLAFNTRRQLRHQHQLAELRRREHPELPDPDARAHGAELPLRGDRHGRAGGADSRPDPAQQPGHRQLLDRPHPQHALHPAAPRALAVGRPGLPGRRPDPQALPAGGAAAASDGRGADGAGRSRPSRSARRPRRWRSSS